jgi:tetratricopeptide (TPR) repeat protein
VDRAGDLFEDAWEAGQRPRIEEYLTDAAEPERSVLLHELLVVELGQRRRGGDTPVPAEYLDRFPDHTALIKDAFGEEGTPAGGADRPTPDCARTYREPAPDNRCPSEPAPIVGSPATVQDAAGAAAGTLPTISGYEVLEELGRGGMGIVYRARHTRLQRVVALKMIRAGVLATSEELSRFRSEAALQARVHHQHIVQIFEIGEAVGGPYLALEFVDGASLEKKIAGTPQPALSAAQLVETLARAVHHAHGKGLVHRDLKPANILVTDAGTPKVGDFGLARRLEGEAGQTQSGALVGTPSYMAPEQAFGRLESIGPATDVYALGAILYALLTGRPPFLGANALDTVVQVRHQEPVAPRRLLASVPRDLDTICLKCLHKESAKRYASAEALANDLRRFLNREPIDARPSPWWERTFKWMRRKPTAATLMGASVLSVITLFGVVLGFTLQLQRAVKATQEERDRADRQRAVAQAVNAFLQDDLLGQADIANQPIPAGAAERNPDVTVRELLDRAATRIKGRFRDQPEIEAAIRQTIGDAYVALGQFNQAEEQMEWVVAWRRENLGDEQLDTLQSLNGLASVYAHRGRYAEAQRLFEETLTARRRQLGPNHPSTVMSMISLGHFYMEQGRYTAAEPVLNEALAVGRQQLGANDSVTLGSLLSLGQLYRYLGRDKDAEPLYQEALAGYRQQLGDDHPDTLNAQNSLGAVYCSQGRYAESEPLFLKTLAVRRRKLGTDHPETLLSVGNMAALYYSWGKYAQAEPLLREALERRRQTLGDEHPDTLRSMNNLGEFFRTRGRPGEAEPLLREALAGFRKKLGIEHPGALTAMNNLAGVCRDRGRYVEALPILEEVLAVRRRMTGDDHPETLKSLNNLAQVYGDLGRHAEAEPLVLEAASRARRQFGLSHASTQHYLRNAAAMYEQTGRPALAEPLWRELTEVAKEQGGPESAAYAVSLAYLGANLLKQHQPAVAEPLLRTSVTIRQEKQPDDWTTFQIQSLLGEALAGQQKNAEAEPMLLEGYEGMKALEKTMPPNGKARLADALERIVKLYDGWGKPEQAATWRKRLDQAKIATKLP